MPPVTGVSPEPISNMHLAVPCGIAGRLGLLTYGNICCAVAALGVLPEAVIWDF
jgi:hypothetical protein